MKKQLTQIWSNKNVRYFTLGLVGCGCLYYLSQTMFKTSGQPSDKVIQSNVQTNILDRQQLDTLENKEVKTVYDQMKKEFAQRERDLNNQKKEFLQKQAAEAEERAKTRQRIDELDRKISELLNYGGKAISIDAGVIPNRVQRNSPSAPPTAQNSQGANGYHDSQSAVQVKKPPQIMAGTDIKIITSAGITSSNKGKVTYLVLDNPNDQELNAKIATLNNRNKNKVIGMSLPATSIITGVLINGLEAPTSLSAKSEPMPVTLRVKKDVLLPNNFRADLKDCNIQGAAIGDLASHRAYIRTTSISCINDKGQSFSQPLEAYAVSEYDGKNGVKGELISRNGEALRGAALAGGLSALSSGVSPRSVQSLQTNPDSRVGYQYPSLAGLAATTAGGAASGAMERLVDYYTAIADQQWPVIEVSPGTSVTFILLADAVLPSELISR